ncbi:hypothetical protein [Fervidobacterium sp.]
MLDYYAPTIIDIRGEKFIDLHSLNIVNFLGIEPSKKYQQEIDGWLFNVHEYEGVLIDSENLIPYSQENFEKFKISNTLSIEQLKYTDLYNKLFLKAENSLNNLECVISLGNNYLLEHIEVFANKKFEFVLELHVSLKMRNLFSNFNVKATFNHPFIFLVDFITTSYENAYKLLEEIRKLNEELSEKIPKLYNMFQKEPFDIDRMMSNVNLSDFIKTIYNYGDLKLLIEDLEILISILSKLQVFK